jgi:hypothetical protein
LCDTKNEIIEDVIVEKNKRNISFNQNEEGDFKFHLGSLVFAPYFAQLTNNDLGFIKQWLISVLLGAQNVEQTKKLNFKSLNSILGKTIKKSGNQRLRIQELATQENIEKILKFNGYITQVQKRKDLYYDPHSIHYTGLLKTLSVWCAGIRLADKGINMDFIHTTDGYPVYFNTNDNFYDMRERFLANIKAYRKLMDIPPDMVLTHILDRGVYSMDVFSEIINSLYEHIITWEKDYNNDKWDDSKEGQAGCIIKYRNNSKDARLVHYRYQEGIWDKNPKMRQIIVRVFDKSGKVSIEVSVLTDDLTRETKEIIELMLKRWVQENDFKYLIKHFGINEITTYAFTDYKDVKDKMEDKLYTCTKHKSLTKEIHRIRAKQKTALLRKHEFEAKYKESNSPLSPAETDRRNKIWKEVDQLTASVKELIIERKNTNKKVSKLDELIEHNYQKLDTNTKSLMDAIKILARNIFYLSFQPFKKKYDNYRDDHVQFRSLTLSGGTMKLKNGEWVVTLIPTIEYPKRIRKIIAEVLQETNSLSPEMPDGSGIKLRVKI